MLTPRRPGRDGSRPAAPGSGRRSAYALVLAGALVALAPAPGAAAAGAETLDGAGGPGGRITAEISGDTHAVVVGGVVHLFAYDATGGDLRHGWKQGSTWRFETVDGAGGAGGRVSGNVGRTMSAVVDGTSLHVFYADVTRGDLRQATLSAQGGWRFATLDGSGGPAGRVTGSVGGGSSSIVLGGQLNVFYSDGTRKDVRRAVLGPRGWSFSVLDGAGGSGGRRSTAMGGYTRVAVVGGVPHVLYTAFDEAEPEYDWQWGVVRDARLIRGSWSVTDVDRYPWPFGDDLSVANVGGQLFVSLTWHGEHSTSPMVRRLDGATWTRVAGPPCVDDAYSNCSLTGLTVLGDRLGMLVDDASAAGYTGALHHRTWDGSTWSAPRAVDRTGGNASTVTVGGRTTAFYTAGGDLRSAQLG